MSVTPNSYTLRDDDFIFLSPHKSLVARGTFATLTHPAESGHDAGGAFQQQVQQHFAAARLAGIKKPIITGAIPFDKRQPCLLSVPQSYDWVDRTAIAPPPAPEPFSGDIRYQPDHDAFCDMVAKALDTLHTPALDKVVLSRLLNIESDQPLNTLRLWGELNRQNPGSYNFHLPMTDGTLIGASPELLLRKHNALLQSLPLAGSAPRDSNPHTDRLAGENLQASAKDRHEHLIVIADIRRSLAGHCQQLDVLPTSLLSTPKLWHLATEIQATVNNNRENALSLACRLHPTPALCGAPYAEARDLITTLEPFNREWFGGIVGWCDDQGNGEWVVAIRCGKVSHRQITLFAGAGIVPASQPESEWRETGTKLGTMLNALGVVVQPAGTT
ncbi:isochorismate synthase [Shimwellia pseudoproteus]|uniref:isochorismate synthase n=1 Tax=Shimwellia pseudoproteus TaxID=570012 RepID=UPI0018EDA168|nr:isochorismate synthase [Shimwellia pseudoproteus]MBJ3816854.1 isochorismate synthase [Shimwellia pseudoproteus]